MGFAELEQYAEQVIQNQRIAPRSIDTNMLWNALWDKQSLLGMGIGVMGLFSATYFAFVPRNNPSEELLYGVVVATLLFFGLIFTLSPIRNIRRWYLVLRYGEVDFAEVTKIAGTQSSFRGMEHGGGTAEVEYMLHRNGQKVALKYVLDQPWVKNLREGSRLRVLVYPKNPKIVVELGP